MSMFCNQCQEAAKGTGCVIAGVCGKEPEVSNLQDLLVFVVKGVSILSTEARKSNIEVDEVNKYVFDSLFSTITNANFDTNVFISKIRKGLALREKIKQNLIEAGVEMPAKLPEAATWTATSIEEMTRKADSLVEEKDTNEDIRSAKELILYGLKGLAAYAEHAWNLDIKDADLNIFIQRALAEITDDNKTLEELVALTMETGKYGVTGMAMLDGANTAAYGNPEISKVNIGTGYNPGILISGHDLRDMEDLLKQTEGTGVDVYTHSEMLPANYYPAFKKYKHLVGNYGNAWWKQAQEFESFNGPILFTTNCLVPPRNGASYIDKVYTTGAAGFAGFKHIADRPKGGQKDFSEIIEQAKRCQAPVEIEKGHIVGGFAHNQVMALAGDVIDAVKSGAIKKFVVMAGCDGRMKGREYYTDFAEALPKDSVILTAGCAKYRYNKLELGDINGIPRVLDAGQCNDSYSLAVIALKLKEVFGLDDINKLPIVYNIAWYEQKAVIVLLALLYLGVKNIHLGPTLPAFLSPNVTNLLVETFGISGISDVETDIKAMFN